MEKTTCTVVAIPVRSEVFGTHFRSSHERPLKTGRQRMTAAIHNQKRGLGEQVGQFLRVAHKCIEEGQHAAEVVKVEDAPADDDKQDAIDVEEHRRDVLLDFQYGVLLNHDDKTEIESPDDEIPTGSVPHTCEEPHNEDVQRLMMTVAAQRDVEIVAEETA